MEVKNNVNNNINESKIGNAKEMSVSDILTLNKVYSCANRVSTNGGGNQQVYCTCLMTFCVHLQNALILNRLVI
jgi:hypothetical protein